MKENYRKLITGFCLTIFAIVTGFASILGLPEDKETLRTILLIVAIISLFLSFYFYLSQWIRFSSLPNLLIKSKKLGIYKIHETGLSNTTLTNRLRNSKIIKIFFATGIAFFRTREDDIIKAFENNANILILLSTETSDFTNEIEQIESRNTGEIAHEIEQVKTILNRCLSEAKKNTSGQCIGKFTIKHFTSHLRIPFVICDDEYAWITLTLPPARSVQSISFEAIKTEKGLLRNCINHFDEIWSIINENSENKKADDDSLIDFLVGDWKNEWTVDNNTGMEICKITNDGKYFVNNEHWFNIKKLQLDASTGKLIFIKASVRENDNRRLMNELNIANPNKLEGIESNYNIKYFRL